jgi:hypothetical protein
MIENYKNYALVPLCKKLSTGRYSVAIRIKELNNKGKSTTFYDKTTTLILEQEAQKESLILGKRLIDKGMIEL